MANKRLTYWQVLQKYHSELYRSRLYWTSGAFVFFALICIIISGLTHKMDWLIAGAVFGVIGGILLGISKLIIVRRVVSL